MSSRTFSLLKNNIPPLLRFFLQWLRFIAKSTQVNFFAWRRFWKSFREYQRLSGVSKRELLKNLYPCIGDDTDQTFIEPIYFYQDTWAFEKIIKRHPEHHYDVGSHNKFVAFLSKVLPVTMVDIRPLSLPLESLFFQEGSILNLPFEDDSIDSLSSLCVVEHIGLGRYGDPLDPKGSEKAIQELIRVLKRKGILYLSLPIDVENKIYFNAHRAFTEEYIQEIIHPLKIIEKKYIFGSCLTSIRPSSFAIALYEIEK